MTTPRLQRPHQRPLLSTLVNCGSENVEHHKHCLKTTTALSKLKRDKKKRSSNQQKLSKVISWSTVQIYRRNNCESFVTRVNCLRLSISVFFLRKDIIANKRLTVICSFSYTPKPACEIGEPGVYEWKTFQARKS
jgi:hypothetical protein